MDPPLRERVRWRNATDNDVERPATRANMARTASLLTAAGALVCLIAVLVPGDGQLHDDILLATAAAAGVMSVALMIAYDRIPFWGFHVVAVLDTALFTAAAYGWGSMSAYGPLPYVWVTGFVFYFFSRLRGARRTSRSSPRRMPSRSWRSRQPRTRSTAGSRPWPPCS